MDSYQTEHLEIQPKSIEEVRNITSCFSYVSPFFYNLQIIPQESDGGWKIELVKRKFEHVFVKKQDEKMFQDHKNNAFYFFAHLRNKKTQIGWFCVELVEWNKTARLWDIDIYEPYRNQGYGSEIMSFIKEFLQKGKSRAILLECQSSNYPAIQFYRKHGFRLGGFDCIAYSNEDIQKHEIRLEMVFTF